MYKMILKNPKNYSYHYVNKYQFIYFLINIFDGYMLNNDYSRNTKCIKSCHYLTELVSWKYVRYKMSLLQVNRLKK